MDALGAFVLTAPTAFALGWLLRGFTEQHIRGNEMQTKTKKAAGRFIDWLADLRKLTVLVVLVGVAVLSSIVYTWSADQQSENRTEAVMECIAHYVAGQSEAQAPRTLAANRAADARRDWDRGFSAELPNASKATLKKRYLALYDESIRVRSTNPLPRFDAAFCEEFTR